MTFHHPALLYMKLPLRDKSLSHCLNSLKMATRVLWVPFASICMIFAMLLSVVMSDSVWSYVHSPIPTPSPNTGRGKWCLCCCWFVSSFSHNNVICLHSLVITFLPLFLLLVIWKQWMLRSVVVVCCVFCLRVHGWEYFFDWDYLVVGSVKHTF